MKIISTLMLGGALVVGACSDANSPARTDTATTQTPTSSSATNDTADEAMTQTGSGTENAASNSDKGTHPGGDAIELAGLGQGDVPELDGEIGCSFSVPESKQPLVIAKGNVDAKASVFGVYKVGTSVERIGGGPGGFAKLSKGMQLSGKGMTLDIALTSTKSNATGNESTSHPATLTLNRADGGKRVYTGTWNCGP